MPKKANTKYTGFYWYMQAILPDLRRQGRAFANGLADVVPVARPLWNGNNHCMFLTFCHLETCALSTGSGVS